MAVNLPNLFPVRSFLALQFRVLFSIYITIFLVTIALTYVSHGIAISFDLGFPVSSVIRNPADEAEKCLLAKGNSPVQRSCDVN